MVGSGGTVEVACSESDPLCAYVFKMISEAHVGELSFVRVYSGRITQNIEVTNAKRNASERIGTSFFMQGKDRMDAGRINAGDIGALVKLRNTHTGDTLCDKNRQILLSEVDWPKPNISFSVVPRTKGDEDKVANGLHRLHEEDPTFYHEVDGELNQTLIYGQGELHLDVMVKRLLERFGVAVDLEKPRIPYRETIRKKAEAQYRHKKQTGGRGQFGDVHLRIEPLERGTGHEFVDATVGGVIPGKFIPAVEKGVVEALASGITAGCKVVDVRATVFFGSYHPVDSSEIAFKLAGLNAFKNAMKDAGPILLEPVYKVEVTVPEEFMGDVMGDLSGRRGKILGMDLKGPFQVIRALIPLANLFRYSTDLRSMTGGRGLHSRAFDHYEEVPSDVMVKIQEEFQKQKEAEEKD
jgi:elongation factor G